MTDLLTRIEQNQPVEAQEQFNLKPYGGKA
jgi:hypothetical protein